MVVPENSYQPQNRADWRDWLTEHHNQTEGVWLIRFKKSAGKPYLKETDAIEEALCFGWIDSLPRKLDEERTMLYFSPRKPGSNWSALNKQRAKQLIETGLMMSAGMVKIEQAKADGSWNALDSVEALEIPPDLVAAFSRYPNSEENFHAFPRSTKRGILEWILNAKRPTTRTKRIEKTARLAAENIRANQWHPKKKD